MRLRNGPIWWNWIVSLCTSNGDGDGAKILTTMKCNVGDIVAIKDYKGMYVCKRIIGVEGDQVWRYGEYATKLYNNKKGFGIPEITTRGNGSGSSSRSQIPQLPSWEGDVEMIHLRKDSSSQSQSLWTKVVVPQGHVWVEGDNPLFSIDSRHYGPVTLENVCGRVIYRLWPRVRRGNGIHRGRKTENEGAVTREISGDDEHEYFERDSCFMSSKRPLPITEDEMVKGPYGIRRRVATNV